MYTAVHQYSCCNWRRNSLKPAAHASGDYAPCLTVPGFRLQASNAVGLLDVGGKWPRHADLVNEKKSQLDVFGVDNPLLATAKFLYIACV
jgi:hypothetical protein